MTAETRFERQLPAILEDLYLGPSPDYRDEVLAAAVRIRQRPSWTFAGRWLPMADITSRAALAPRVPWRAIAVALIIVALLLAGAVALIGSRQHRVPAPFGVAGNGLIAYAANGDIFTADPATGAVTTISTGPDGDSDPIFSPDGTRIAFLRTSFGGDAPGKDVVVVGADGSSPVVVTAKPIDGGPTHVEWAKDSRSLLTGAQNNSTIQVFDATKAADPRVIATDADPYLRPYQPPDGSSILVRRSTADGLALVRLDLATLHETVLAKGGPQEDLGAARWSPNGSKVVYNSSTQDDPGLQRIFVVNADGTGTRQIPAAPGTWTDIDPAWSPDGSRIAYTRYERTGSTWDVRPIAIFSIADGSIRSVGPLPREVRAQRPSPGDASATYGEGFNFEWSPDGESLIALPGEGSGHPIVINTRDGTWHGLDPIVAPGFATQSWQRLAP